MRFTRSICFTVPVPPGSHVFQETPLLYWGPRRPTCNRLSPSFVCLRWFVFVFCEGLLHVGRGRLRCRIHYVCSSFAFISLASVHRVPDWRSKALSALCRVLRVVCVCCASRVCVCVRALASRAFLRQSSTTMHSHACRIYQIATRGRVLKVAKGEYSCSSMSPAESDFAQGSRLSEV